MTGIENDKEMTRSPDKGIEDNETMENLSINLSIFPHSQ